MARFEPDKYWIPREEIEQSPKQMYRAYIFNYQEDMWKAFKARSVIGIKNRLANIKFIIALVKNYIQFQRHLEDPENNQIQAVHLILIRNSLQDVLDCFEGDTSSIFYKAVKRVYDEFA